MDPVEHRPSNSNLTPTSTPIPTPIPNPGENPGENQDTAPESDASRNRKAIETLLNKGVRIPLPDTVFIDPEIDPERISGQGVIIFPGCRLHGRDTLISSGAKIGGEGPAVIDNCHIGPRVRLAGGYFRGAVFLAGAAMGNGAHAREGSILEEQASGAHTVGIKQTILFPFATLGSLINFCDCLMSGGTSRRNHSEVGSGYIHFNYTPHQDKATPSLLGDVPRGVMLNQPPIFLGGQGGLVGPCRLAFGTVIAAGAINRKDETRRGHLIMPPSSRGGTIPYAPGHRAGVARLMRNNLIYIANMVALSQWYAHVRRRFIGPDLPEPLHEGLTRTLKAAIDERVRRLSDVASHIHADNPAAWTPVADSLAEGLTETGDTRLREDFLERIEPAIRARGADYLAVITGLDPEDAASGTRWLQQIVDRVSTLALNKISEV